MGISDWREVELLIDGLRQLIRVAHCLMGFSSGLLSSFGLVGYRLHLDLEFFSALEACLLGFIS